MECDNIISLFQQAMIAREGDLLTRERLCCGLSIFEVRNMYTLHTFKQIDVIYTCTLLRIYIHIQSPLFCSFIFW